MRLGVCYYPEQWPAERWAIDARMMHDAGLEIVRIAEFAWAKMEPAPGRYEWAWLDQAVEVLANAGLAVVLGTPTVTPPAWLTAAHPAMLHVDANGRRRRHGSRRHACVNHPVYREHSVRIVTEMARRYSRSPNVIGWQIDNEFGGGKTARCYCDTCAAAFRHWLQLRYGSLETLNDAWGAVFWSQTYSDWSQIPVPDKAIDKPNSSHELDYYRFCSASYGRYQQAQIDILRQWTAGFITHNFMGLFRDLDQFDLAAPLDFATWDSYPTGNPDRWRQLLDPVGARVAYPRYAYDTGDPIITAMAHALTRGLKHPLHPSQLSIANSQFTIHNSQFTINSSFWVMEQQCGHINWGDTNPGIRPGTVRLWTWHALAEGAGACIYFRWRPTLFAQEQYHSGLLYHDGRPAPGYQELLTMAKEQELMSAVAAQPFTAQVAILFSYNDLWALELQPHRADFHYLRHLYVYYHALQRLGVPVNLVSPAADLASYKIVLAPTLHMPDEALEKRLRDWVTDGGTLLLGVRSGFKTPTNLVTDRPLPGLLRELSGVTVTSWQSLPAGVGIEVGTPVPGLAGQASYWVETLQLDDRPLAQTESLAHYETGEVALAANAIGRGQVYTLGWYPTPEQAQVLITHLLDKTSITSIATLPPGVVAAQRGPFTLLLNFSDQVQQAVVGGRYIDIAPRDVAVIRDGEK